MRSSWKCSSFQLHAVYRGRRLPAVLIRASRFLFGTMHRSGPLHEVAIAGSRTIDYFAGAIWPDFIMVPPIASQAAIAASFFAASVSMPAFSRQSAFIGSADIGLADIGLADLGLADMGLADIAPPADI